MNKPSKDQICGDYEKFLIWYGQLTYSIDDLMLKNNETHKKLPDDINVAAFYNSFYDASTAAYEIVILHYDRQRRAKAEERMVQAKEMAQHTLQYVQQRVEVQDILRNGAFVIISGDNGIREGDDFTSENLASQLDAMGLLYHWVAGSYHGQEELSLLVYGNKRNKDFNPIKHRDFFLNLGKQFAQDSIIFGYWGKQYELAYCDDERHSQWATSLEFVDSTEEKNYSSCQGVTFVIDF